MVALRWRLTWGVVALIALSASPRAWAGHPQERQGFWIGFGGGYGSAGIDCEDCDTSEREGSFTLFFKLGGTLNEHVLLGVETNGWIKEEGSTTLTLGTITGTVTFYPQASSGFFLKAGVGGSWVNTEERLGSVTVSVDKWGWGVLTGIGYDIRVAKSISITPSVNYYFGQSGDIAILGTPALPGFKHNVVDFVVGITFH
jgi:hypothetical protein